MPLPSLGSLGLALGDELSFGVRVLHSLWLHRAALGAVDTDGTTRTESATSPSRAAAVQHPAR